jgi:hypothetical protein
MTRFPQITLLHGKGDSPEGSVKSLEVALRSAHPMLQYARPLIPDNLDAEKAAEWFENFYLYRVPQASLLVGIDRGGLIACAVQNALPGLRLSVVAINAPTEEDGLIAYPSAPESRLALYSSTYPPVKGRCDWKKLTSLAYDVSWLTPGCENFYPLAYLISAWSRNADMDKEISMLFPPAL